MNINYISYLNPFKFHGGGELDNRFIIKEGISRGHSIKLISRLNNKYVNRLIHPRYQLHKKPDLSILCDIHNIPEYGLSFRKGFIENIIQNEDYVHMDNAYVDICSCGPLPCMGDKDKCLSSCSVVNSHDIYKNSIVNFFLSPLHANVINKFWNDRFINKSFIVNPLIDTSSFYDLNLKRDIEYLYVGSITKYKGYENIIQKYGDKVLFIGKNATGSPIIGNHIPYVKNEDLIHYFNRAKNFIHLPNWLEPMGRTIIEAALCGCKIISNENVGATSFDFDISDPNIISKSASMFWDKIENLKK